MKSDYDKVTEAEVRKSIREGFKRLKKYVRNEPALIIDLGDSDSNVPKDKIAIINAWLFKRG